MKETANPQLSPGDRSETDDDESRGSAWVVWLVALPIVYILSIGPVAFITKNSPKATDALRKVYAPVIWLHENTVLRKPLELYVGLFEVH